MTVPNTGVRYTRTELNILLFQYMMIHDCIIGEPAIKGLLNQSNFGVNYGEAVFNGGGETFYNNAVLLRAQRYLPKPNPTDQSAENKARYKAYVERAVFYNVTSRTLEGLVGQLYLIDPVIKLPPQLKTLELDADGEGLSIIQFSKRAVRHTVSYGRAGILTDYPQRNTPTTVGQLATGEVKPIMKVYQPWDIINWHTRMRGVETIYDLIVLRDRDDNLADDGFTVGQQESYRVLRLEDNDTYSVEIHTASDSKKPFVAGNKMTPVDSTGKPFNVIPFTFIGSENNDSNVDRPPLYDLAALNVGHYRNSADYEEASFMAGQPTVWASGLTEDWVKNVMKGKLALGSRGGIPMPAGAQCGMLEAKANSMPREAMKDKEDQMLAIGAKLVIQKRVQKTATESIVDASSESSVLMNISVNVSQAIKMALQFCARFVGGDTKLVQCDLNKDFNLNEMTFDDAAKLVASWQQGAIAFPEMREGLRKAGIATLDDDAARTAIKKDITDGLTVGPLGNDPTGAGGSPNPNADPAGHAKTPAARGQ